MWVKEKGVANPGGGFPYRGQVVKYQSVLACLGVRPLSLNSRENPTYRGQVLEYQFVLGKLLSNVPVIILPCLMYRHDGTLEDMALPSKQRQ